MNGKKQKMKFALVALSAFIISACSSREAPPRTVSDFCLNDKVLSFDLAPGEWADDPGNQFDSDQTVVEILAHNAVYSRLCGEGGEGG